MEGRPDRSVLLPVLATLAVQAMASLAVFGVPVLAPVAAEEMGVEARLIGGFTALVYLVAMVAGLVTGPYVDRYGAIRVSQAAMLASALGMAVLAVAAPWAALVSAFLLGVTYGPVNPAAAEILARVSPPRWRPLIFSIKQTGVPIGGALAGLAIPFLVDRLGWRSAGLAVAGVSLLVLALIQPLRRQFDIDLRTSHRVVVGGFIEPLKLILADRRLRALSLASFTYAGTQISVVAFFVLFLTEALHMPLAVAGLTYAAVQAGGITGRIFWGAIAERLLAAVHVLAGLGILIAIAMVLTAAFAADWPRPAIFAASFLLGTCGFGWNGVCLSEVVRLAPHGKASIATGGIQSFMFGGVVIVPPIFGAVVGASDDYTPAFFVLASLTFLAGLSLMASARVIPPPQR